jgi:hypothetical protein
MSLKAVVLNTTMVLAALLLLVPTSFAAGGDFTLDFVAAAPYTYDHATGGGAFNDRSVGKDLDVVESLQGGDFLCGDTVTYLVAITVDPAAIGNQTIQLEFGFLAETTGQPGVAHADVTFVGINDGNVENGGGVGLGNFAPDTGISDDGGSTATVISEAFSPAGTSPFLGAEELLLVVEIDDLEAGEEVILRIDTLLECIPGSRPTGNLQGDLRDARVVEVDGQPVDEVITRGSGNQTIPFQQIGDIPIDPTAVDLASFTATADSGAILVEWETVSEVDNRGFTLYRASSPDGVRTQLNAGLIPSQLPPGSPEGAAYQFVDESVRSGVTYYYWLEDVDVYGVKTIHGPVSAELSRITRLFLPGRPRPAPVLYPFIISR